MRRFLVSVLALLVTAPLLASSSGISGFSGNPAINGGIYCDVCHSGGDIPLVSLTGPTTVAPGTVHTYTLEIRGGQGIAGGLDVSASNGVLSVTEPGMQVLSGEVTHTQPRNVDLGGRVTWTFDWEAPLLPGSATIYGAGNSVDLAQGNNGDGAAATSLAITVEAATQGPGETSADPLAPLLVTARDPLTGVMDLGYESPCGASDNNVYFGPLSQVSTLGYSGEVCNVGTGGSLAAFDPGSGSFFFLIVANDTADEGSYGQDRDGAGTETERAPFAANVCGVSQNIADSCDAP